MIITIDGPAGTGKSSVARQVALQLNCQLLDTGAMYRAIAFDALRRSVDLSDRRSLVFIAEHCRIAFDWSKDPPLLLLNGEPLDSQLRSASVTQAASIIAAIPAIRQQLMAAQRRIGQEHGRIVTEGRDQGSVVFPDADFKFYLDATPQERARRRVAQLRARGEMVEPAEVLRQIIERDDRDLSRAAGPLKIPSSAVVIDTTNLKQEQVVQKILSKIQNPRGLIE